jgi:hypothetical protein
MRISLRALAVGSTLAGVTACHDATDHDQQTVVGTIDPLHTVVPVIVAPEDVQVNQAFIVVVHTVGSSDCTTPSRNDIRESGDVVRIVPYDIIPMPGHTDVCRDDYAFHEHRLRITRATAGATRIRVVGMSAASREERLDSVETLVMVRP